MKTCCYCNNEFDDEECRPYGVGGAQTCYDCAMLPENKENSDSMCRAAIERAIELGDGAILLGHHEGPIPLPRGEGNN